jgi:hypothetical protein
MAYRFVECDQPRPLTGARIHPASAKQPDTLPLFATTNEEKLAEYADFLGRV